MISEFIITAFLASLSALTSLLPTFNIEFTQDYVSYMTIVNSASQVFPIATLATVTGLSIALLVGLQLWDLIVWVYHQFWGSA